MSQNHPCLPVPSRRRKKRGQNNDTSAPIVFDDLQSIDASEYLSRVVEEAKKLPDVFVSSNANHSKDDDESNKKRQKRLSDNDDFIPIDGSAASLSYLLSNRTSLIPAPSASHLPTNCAHWVDQTLANFSELRRYLDEQKHKQQQENKTSERRQPVPAMKDRPGWHIFCVGESEARGNTGSYFDDDDDADGIAFNDDQGQVEDEKKKQNGPNKAQHEDDRDEAEPWEKGLPDKGFDPHVKLLLQLDQVMIRRALSHLAHYVEEGWSPCTSQRSAWLYALLARLERPIHRIDAAVMYRLLIKLTQIRAEMRLVEDDDNDNDKDAQVKLARMNVLIAIIGIYFEQGGGYANLMTSSQDPN